MFLHQHGKINLQNSIVLTFIEISTKNFVMVEAEEMSRSSVVQPYAYLMT